MNCANVCPKGLNPAKAIAETKKLIAERAASRERRSRPIRADGGRRRPARRDARSGQSRLVQLGRLPARSASPQRPAGCCSSPTGRAAAICRMFPTEAHMNMGGSLHGGSVMSFIDMSMFAGGLCAGMERGHYVTLDLTTHFLARGQAGLAARRACRAGQADPRPRLPPGRRQAERRALLQLQRHAEAGEPAATRPSHDADPSGAPTTQLIAANELKPDPAQAARRRRARSACRRASAIRRQFFSRLFGSQQRGPGRRLSVGRRRARQVDADGPRLRAHRRRAEAPRPLPRIHARDARAAADERARARKAIRSSPSPRRSPPRRSCSASTRCRSPTPPTR